MNEIETCQTLTDELNGQGRGKALRYHRQSWQPSSSCLSDHQTYSYSKDDCLDDSQSIQHDGVHFYNFLSSSCPSLENPNIMLSYMSDMLEEDGAISQQSDHIEQFKTSAHKDGECQTDTTGVKLGGQRYAILQPAQPPGGSKKRYIPRKKGQRNQSSETSTVQSRDDRYEAKSSEAEPVENQALGKSVRPKQENPYKDVKVKPETDAVTSLANEFVGDDMEAQKATKCLVAEMKRVEGRQLLTRNLIDAIDRLGTATVQERAGLITLIMVLKAQWKAGL